MAIELSDLDVFQSEDIDLSMVPEIVEQQNALPNEEIEINFSLED